MACETCGHSMALLGVCENSPIYHCERCGTVSSHGTVYVPKLVDRCRKFSEKLEASLTREQSQNHWHSLGIAESIRILEERHAT